MYNCFQAFTKLYPRNTTCVKTYKNFLQEHWAARKKELYLNKGGTWVTNMRMWFLTTSLSLWRIFCWASTREKERSANKVIHYLNPIYSRDERAYIPDSWGDQFFATKFLKWILATCRTPMSQLLSTMICNSLTRCWGAYWNCTYKRNILKKLR